MVDAATRERLRRENAELTVGIAELERTIAAARRPVEAGARDEMATLQSRADAVALHFNETAPAPRIGEQPSEYRLRLLQKFQRYSASFDKMDLSRADAAFLAAAEPKIYADAEAAGRDIAGASGQLIPTSETFRGGMPSTRYHGDIAAFMLPFMSGARCVRIVRPGF